MSPHSSDKRTTRVRAFDAEPSRDFEFTAGVSLHSHTHHSREVLVDLPSYIAPIPILGRLFRRELRRYIERNGVPADFSKGWWYPPVTPTDVLSSETGQIQSILGLPPLVSITDHDNIRAGLELHALPLAPVPLSVEWTMPFEDGVFHLGVHNLPPGSAQDLVLRMNRYTENGSARQLLELLEELNGMPQVLLVLNHPLWDLARLGSSGHSALLRRFLDEHGPRVHALELNGYRSWRENEAIRALAAESALCAVSGGDRHGCAPNAMLNLTRASSFGEFVEELRGDGVSEIAIMPAYRERLAARRMAGAADVLRRRPNDTREHWTDRVEFEWEGVIHPLSHQWPDGGPLWIRTSLGMLQALTNPRLLPVVRLCLPRDRPAFHPNALLDPPAPPSFWRPARGNPSQSQASV